MALHRKFITRIVHQDNSANALFTRLSRAQAGFKASAAHCSRPSSRLLVRTPRQRAIRILASVLMSPLYKCAVSRIIELFYQHYL